LTNYPHISTPVYKDSDTLGGHGTLGHHRGQNQGKREGRKAGAEERGAAASPEEFALQCPAASTVPPPIPWYLAGSGQGTWLSPPWMESGGCFDTAVSWDGGLEHSRCTTAACTRGCDRGGISGHTNESVHVLALCFRGAESLFHGLTLGISFLRFQTFLAHRLRVAYHL